VEDLAAISLDRADMVKAGLQAALDAAESFEASSGVAASEWLASARVAVEKLDPTTPMGLQRAEVQDAFRALADAVIALVERGA
jgi:hypothetical protein